MFSAYDLQCKDYFHTGRNSKTRIECEEAIIAFLTEGNGLSEREVEDWQKEVGNKEILATYEVRIDKHQEKVDGD